MVFTDNNKRFGQWAIALSLLVFVLITIDITGDYRDGVPWTHLLIEMLILMPFLIGSFLFWLALLSICPS